MAMLTFLRIGKEIYDETEVYITEHLIRRRQSAFRRGLEKILSLPGRAVSLILKAVGLDGLL